MQIIIPMSGYGERFRRAGYDTPKPLIEVDGRPIIEYVVGMFPGESDFIFICNREHLEEPRFRMREIIVAVCPTAKIIGIEPHKLGPVNAILEAKSLIKNNQPVIVNYCDFTCYWDYSDFKKFVEISSCDGVIPCYTGFHPHLLRSVNFAYVKEESNRVIDIQEKLPFTDIPMSEYASSGTYYFRSGQLLLEYCSKSMKSDLALNGEFYVSMVYKPMLEDGKDIAVFPLQHFMQWGTPEDLAEYRYFLKMFKLLAATRKTSVHSGTIMVPMAGLGSRFKDSEFKKIKPLISVSGRSMAIQATLDLPKADQYVFIARNDMYQLKDLIDELQTQFNPCKFVLLDKKTDGQAITCLAGMAEVNHQLPLTIGACDNGMIYDVDKFDALLSDPEVDVIIWGARGYPGASQNPSMYGWIDLDGDSVVNVSVKKPLNNIDMDPIITGTFTFKRAADFLRSTERMILNNGLINGEFYVDSCINESIALGLRVRMLEVQTYICWGTPEDLKRFEYWQSCFHKWSNHPYRLEADLSIPVEALSALRRRYSTSLIKLIEG